MSNPAPADTSYHLPFISPGSHPVANQFTIQEKLVHILSHTKPPSNTSNTQSITLLDPPSFLIENPRHKMLETFNFPKERFFSPKTSGKFSSSQVSFKRNSMHRTYLKNLAEWADLEINRKTSETHYLPKPFNLHPETTLPAKNKTSYTETKNSTFSQERVDSGPQEGLFLKKLQIYKTLFFKLIEEVKKQSKTQGFLFQRLWDDLFTSINEGFESCEKEALELEKGLLDQIARLHEIYQRKLALVFEEKRMAETLLKVETEKAEKLMRKNLFLKKASGKGRLVHGQLREKLEELQESNKKLYKENLQITMAASDLDSDIFQSLNRKYLENVRTSLLEMLSDQSFVSRLSQEKLARLRKLSQNLESSTGLTLEQGPLSNLTEILKTTILEDDPLEPEYEDFEHETLFMDRAVETDGIIPCFSEGVDTSDLIRFREYGSQCEIYKTLGTGIDIGVQRGIEGEERAVQTDFVEQNTVKELNFSGGESENPSSRLKYQVNRLRMLKRESSPVAESPKSKRQAKSSVYAPQGLELNLRASASKSPREIGQISIVSGFESPQNQDDSSPLKLALKLESNGESIFRSPILEENSAKLPNKTVSLIKMNFQTSIEKLQKPESRRGSLLEKRPESVRRYLEKKTTKIFNNKKEKQTLKEERDQEKSSKSPRNPIPGPSPKTLQYSEPPDNVEEKSSKISLNVVKTVSEAVEKKPVVKLSSISQISSSKLANKLKSPSIPVSRKTSALAKNQISPTKNLSVEIPPLITLQPNPESPVVKIKNTPEKIRSDGELLKTKQSSNLSQNTFIIPITFHRINNTSLELSLRKASIKKEEKKAGFDAALPKTEFKEKPEEESPAARPKPGKRGKILESNGYSSKRLEVKKAEARDTEEKQQEIVLLETKQTQTQKKGVENRPFSPVLFIEFDASGNNNPNFLAGIVSENGRTFAGLLERLRKLEATPNLLSSLSKFHEINTKVLKTLLSELSLAVSSVSKPQENPYLSLKNRANDLHEPNNSYNLLPQEDTLVTRPNQGPRAIKAQTQHFNSLSPVHRMFNRRSTLEIPFFSRTNRDMDAAQQLVHERFLSEKGSKKLSILNLSNVLKLISMVYTEALRKMRRGEKIENFILIFYDFFVKRYGLKSIAEGKMLLLLHSCYGREASGNLRVQAFKEFLGLEPDSGFNNFETYLRNLYILDDNLKRNGFALNLERLVINYSRIPDSLEVFEGKLEDKYYKRAVKEIEKLATENDREFIDKFLKILGRMEKMVEKTR